MLGPCRRGLTALILIACVGCPDSSEAERQAELDAAWARTQAKLTSLSAQLPRLATAAAELERVAAPRWELEGPVDCRPQAGSERNALVVQIEELGAGQPSYLLNLGDQGVLRTVEAVGAGEVPSSVVDMVAASGLRYALLVRVHEVKGPVVPEGDVSKFEPGWVRGDVLLFDVEDGACKASFPFEGTNSEAVQPGVEDPEQWAQDDLFRRTRRAIHDGIEALGPGNQGPLASEERLR